MILQKKYFIQTKVHFCLAVTVFQLNEIIKNKQELFMQYKQQFLIDTIK